MRTAVEKIRKPKDDETLIIGFLFDQPLTANSVIIETLYNHTDAEYSNTAFYGMVHDIHGTMSHGNAEIRYAYIIRDNIVYQVSPSLGHKKVTGDAAKLIRRLYKKVVEK